jgi:replicative DNA helicase
MESISEMAGAGSDLKVAKRRTAQRAVPTDRLPPHSVEAEQGVLGCVLDEPGTLNQLAEARTEATWFYDLRHQVIFQAIQAVEREQKPVDLISVQQKLKDWQRLEEVGGIVYLNELQDGVQSVANLPTYLGIVKQQRLARQIIEVCTAAIAQVYEPGDQDVEKLALTAEANLSALTETSSERTEKTLKQIVHEVIEDMEKHHYTRGSTQLRGLPTGMPGIYMDKLLRGIRDDFYVVAAGRPGSGKTSWALNVVEHLALDYVWRKPTGNKLKTEAGEEYPETVEQRGIPVGVFSLEMSNQSLGYRMLFGRAGVDTGEYNSGYASKEDEQNLALAAGSLTRGSVIIDDASGQSINQIAAKARRWVKQYGIKLFVLDYLQLTEGDNDRDEDRVRLAKISKKIVALKKQLNVPWLVLAQMNRNIETSEAKRVPVLSDLKDCGAIEQDADVVLFFYTPDRKTLDYAPEGGKSDKEILDQVCADWDWSKRPARVNAFIAKHRYGPTGKVELLFQKNLCRYEDWHMWKVKHGVEARKAGERESVVGKGQKPLIDDEDVPL